MLLKLARLRPKRKDEIMQNIEIIKKTYERLSTRVVEARKVLGRPLTLAEKILVGHLEEINAENLVRRQSHVGLKPDRVAMQDATAQMALLQFMVSGVKEAQVPSTVHCDHLIRAHVGADADLQTAESENNEVYHFLSSASQKYGIGFWKPGAGIIHQVVLENYAFPGGMMIGTDSHTPNAGGLGMIAIGVGGADAVDVMVGQPFGLRWPGVIGVKLTGQMQGWTSPKDVILKVLEILTVKGGTGHIVEYFGPGTSSISCTGKGTICNMGAEHGATTSVFPYDSRMADYLKSTGRAEWATLADGVQEHLQPDAEVMENPEKYYDRVIEIDLNTLEPYIVGPHSPDKARGISKFAEEIQSEGYPDQLKYTLIGSCTNSSYEDIGRSAYVLDQAMQKGLKLKVPLMVTPGSEQIYNTIERDGLLQIFEKAGATVLANACGPCIGQWKRDDISKGERNSIISSYNRNFRGRNDGNAETLSFISSPEIVTAMALAGRLSFNPITDELQSDSGETVKLAIPQSDDLPSKGFDMSAQGFISPVKDGESLKVVINPESDRLQELTPFDAWDGNDFEDLPILAKVKGKCTTDHISMAGPWLKYRGHLDNISNNLLLGGTNAFTGEIGKGKNVLTGEQSLSYPKIARDYKEKNTSWVIVGDENYGEGSSREHAAMEPRHLGCRAVIVKSFARIHETNLKKQGVLPLVFVNPDDYELFGEMDRVSLINLQSLAPNKTVRAVIKHQDGTHNEIDLQHTMTQEQIEWFKAGSALNKIGADLNAA